MGAVWVAGGRAAEAFWPAIASRPKKRGRERERGREGGELDTAAIFEVSTRGTLRSILWQLWLADQLIPRGGRQLEHD